MKHIGLLALALILTPALASAQTAPPMSPMGAAAPSPAMQQMHDQMKRLHEQTRSQMLGALTPQHRTLLANVVGQLAISPTPNVQAAAQQLDSALSPGESQAILAAESSMRNQMHAAMQNVMPPGGANRPPTDDQRPAHTPDAGMALLHAALAVGGPMRHAL